MANASIFRDYVKELQANVSRGNATEQAYARSDLFERRRALMQLWADYLAGEPQGELAQQHGLMGSGHGGRT